MIRSVGVVVPAHNEQDRLPSCLASLRRAARAVRGMPVHLVVVADASRDRTDHIARRGGATVITTDARSVGAARAAGVREVLRRVAHLDAADVWLATTDADTLVPPCWLRDQARYANRGWDAVAGTIRVADWPGHQPGNAGAVPPPLRRGRRAARPRARRQPRLPCLGLPAGRRVSRRAHRRRPGARRGAGRYRQPGPAHPRAHRAHLGPARCAGPHGFGDYLAGLDAETGAAPA